jgi:hypothetical protein
VTQGLRGLGHCFPGCDRRTRRRGADARPVSLPGWRAVDGAPGSRNRAECRVTRPSQTDSPALVKDGDAIRATSFVFVAPEDAAEAQKRGAGDDYQRALEEAFRGNTVGRGPGVGVRLKVPRPTGEGADTVEVYLLRRGRVLTVVELESGAGFDPTVRRKALGLFSR